MGYIFSVRFLGRLDTWQLDFLEVEEMRYEISEYNIDLTLWEQFSSLEMAHLLPDARAPHNQNQGVPEGAEFIH